jgi:CRISPR-associated protein Cmr1
MGDKTGKVRPPGELRFVDTSADELRFPLKVVTLLHGGGPIASEGDHPSSPTRNPDPVTPIRVASIRGQLRFWWRATHGCTADNLAQMLQWEDDLWGTAATKDATRNPGRVELRLEGSQPKQKKELTETLGPIGMGLRYGAFATANLTRLAEGMTLFAWVRTFKHSNLSIDECKGQVRDAVHAWLLFGGLGGRTRRGFGALKSEGLPEASEFLQRFGDPSRARVRLVPSLHGAELYLSDRAGLTAHEAHKAALSELRKFRQEVGIARNKDSNSNHPGRSRWPEPDAIRVLTGRNALNHPPMNMPRAFPRAAFGLPIEFKFKEPRQGDPDKSTLIPGKDARGNGVAPSRMASPLILRPIAAGEAYRAGALRLFVPDAPGRRHVLASGRLRLLREDYPDPVSLQLSREEVDRVTPLRDYGGDPDVIASFLSKFGRRVFPKP